LKLGARFIPIDPLRPENVRLGEGLGEVTNCLGRVWPGHNTLQGSAQPAPVPVSAKLGRYYCPSLGASSFPDAAWPEEARPGPSLCRAHRGRSPPSPRGLELAVGTWQNVPGWSAGVNRPVLEKILSSPGPVVLTGPAGSGKTTIALDFYRRFAADLGGSRCLLLVPNGVAARRFQRKLLNESPSGVLVGPKVATFTALSGRILAATGGTGRLLPAFARRLLIERTVDDLAAAGKLPLLGKVAETPGLTQALDRAIAELKRAAVRPEDLAGAGVGRTGKVAELLAVYRRYQDILAQASKRLRGMLITLPLGKDRRQTLWDWTRRTRNRLRETLGSGLREISLASPPTGAQGPALRTLWETAFDLEATGLKLPEDFHIIRAAGMDAEVAAVARRVKKLLAAGSPAGSIAVLARSMDAYRPAIERIFAAHGIPVAPAPRSLREAPAVRFLLEAAALGPEYRYDRVLRVIKSSYFRPAVLGDYTQATVVAAEALIRQGNVFQGRDAYARAGGILRDRLERQVDEDEESPALGPALTSRELTAGWEMLDRLFEVSQPQGRPLAEHLLDLLGRLDLIGTVCQLGEPALIAADLRALERFADLLRQWGEELTSFTSLVRLLATVTCPAEKSPGLVDVLSVLARQP